MRAFVEARVSPTTCITATSRPARRTGACRSPGAGIDAASCARVSRGSRRRPTCSIFRAAMARRRSGRNGSVAAKTESTWSRTRGGIEHAYADRVGAGRGLRLTKAVFAPAPGCQGATNCVSAGSSPSATLFATLSRASRIEEDELRRHGHQYSARPPRAAMAKITAMYVYVVLLRSVRVLIARTCGRPGGVGTPRGSGTACGPGRRRRWRADGRRDRARSRRRSTRAGSPGPGSTLACSRRRGPRPRRGS